MDQDQGVGREIKRLREERGWSMAKLAVEADMSVSGVSMIENGKRNLTTTTLAKLARAYGVEIADLFPKAQAPLPIPEQGEAGLASRPGEHLRPETLEWLGDRGFRYTAMTSEEFNELENPGGVEAPPSRLAELVQKVAREIEELAALSTSAEPPTGIVAACERARTRWFVLGLRMQVQAERAASRSQAS